MQAWWSALFLLTAFFSGSNQQCFTYDDSVPHIETAKYNSWVKSGHAFSVSLFQNFDKERSKPNILLSPWSIQEAFLLAYFGAQGDTEESLAKVLHIPANQGKPLTWQFYTNQKVVNEKYNALKIANKIFVSNKLFLRTCMEQKLEDELELIDYETDVRSAQNYINNYVAKRTDGQIQNFLGDLPQKSSATLVNAVFYHGYWASKFSPESTAKSLFHVKYNVKKAVTMMQKRDSYLTGYSTELRARTLMLPYVGNRTTMIILLPDDGLDNIIKSLNAEILGSISDKKNYWNEEFVVVLPKYKHKSKTRLNTVLNKLGIGDALTENADYSGFTGRREIFFNDVFHEATIEVDEEGTKATGGTGIIWHPKPSAPRDFRCDRPFAYIIYDFHLSKVLFMGTFREP